MHSESEFYVGYLPIPAGLKKLVRRVAILMGLLAVVVAILLVAGQHPFAAATFEFRDYHEFKGTLIAQPYPALLIPGQGSPWLLVGPGKHGVRPMPAGEVRLKGERIARGG